MDFVKAATVDEFEKISHKVIKLIGRPVGIIKRDDGTYFGIEASCKHQGADLLADYRGGTVAVVWWTTWDTDVDAEEASRAAREVSPEAATARVERKGRSVLIIRGLPPKLHRAVRSDFASFARGIKGQPAPPDARPSLVY